MFIGLIVYLVYLCVSCLAEIEGGGVNLVDRRSGVRDALMPIICSVNSGVEPVWAIVLVHLRLTGVYPFLCVCIFIVPCIDRVS